MMGMWYVRREEGGGGCTYEGEQERGKLRNVGQDLA